MVSSLRAESTRMTIKSATMDSALITMVMFMGRLGGRRRGVRHQSPNVHPALGRPSPILVPTGGFAT
jgi:hypothetical protein